MHSQPPSANTRDQNLVFVSYSHADRKWLDRLRVHLKPLERQGAISLWDDSRIKPGTPWREEIRSALEAAKVAVLLVSADFLASDFIATNELPPLLKAAENHGTVILPLIVAHCRFEKTESLSGFQAVNNPSQPLASLDRSRRERWLVKASEIIEDALATRQSLAEAGPRNGVISPRVTKRRTEKRDDLRLRFWNQLLERARKKALPFHANRSPTTAHYISGPVGIPGYSWNYVIWARETAAVELIIDTSDKARNKEAFDALHRSKRTIEASFGAPLEWERLDDKRRSGVRYTLNAGGMSAPESQWPSIQAAMVNAMGLLTSALQPHLRDLAGELHRVAR